MRVADIRIEGFGCLANLALRFTPGMNLVFGANDAGKSTLQEALFALLYGIPSESSAAALKPWHASTCAGSLTYALDDGTAFRVARRFLPTPEASLSTYPAGDDISARIAGAHGRLAFAEAHWGLSREVFEAVCVVRQGALAPLDHPSLVAETLRRRLASAPADATVARATGILATALKERIGAPHSRSKPLAQALARLARLQDEREHALQVRHNLVPRLAELREAAQQLAMLDAARAELLQRREEAERNAMRAPRPAAVEVSAELRRAEAEAAKWQPWAAFPVHLRDSLLRLSAQHAHLREECSLAERRGRRAQEALATFQAQEASLKERLAALDGGQPSSSADFVRIQTLASEWRMASDLEWSSNERWRTTQPSLDTIEQHLAEERRVLEPVLPAGLAGLSLIHERLKQARQRVARARVALSEATAAWARVGMQETEFQKLDRAVQQFRTGTPAEPKPEAGQGRRWFSALLGRGEPEEQAPTGLASHSEIQPIYAELARCRSEAEAAQRALSDVEATTLWQLGKLLGGTLDDSAFDQLRGRLERHLRAEADLQSQKLSANSLRAELDQARERRERTQSALQTELARLGFTSDDLHKALAAYVRQSERKDHFSREDADQERTRLRMETELELVRARTETQRIEVEHWQAKQAALADLEAHTSELLAQAGINARMDALEAAMRTFDEGVENYRRWERAKADLETAGRYQQALRDTQPEPRPASIAAVDGAPVQEIAAEMARLDEERARADDAHSHLEALVQQMMVGVRHLAEIDEEIAQERANIRRLEEFRSALELAHDELGEAAVEFHAQFGPRLESLVREALKQMSQGRFADVVIDADRLALSLPGQEPGALMPIARLGASARDLVYLALRTSIARLLCRSGEKLPLLLDEPLAQCDSARREQAFDYLAQIAEETQVFLFSNDERLRAQFDKQCRSPRHQMHVLGAA